MVILDVLFYLQKIFAIKQYAMLYTSSSLIHLMFAMSLDASFSLVLDLISCRFFVQ